MHLTSISHKLVNPWDSYSEAAQGRNFGEGSNSVGREEVRGEVSEHRLEATGDPDLVEILETAERTEKKRE